MADPTEHPLAVLLRDAASGAFPPPDGTVDIVNRPRGKVDAVVAFTAHSVVATSIDPGEVREHLATDDFGASMDPRFLAWIAERLGVEPGALDVVLVAPRVRSVPPLLLERRPDLESHPRVIRAHRYRTDVHVFSDPARRGLVAIGRGLAGRIEISLEIDEPGREPGLGRLLIASGLHLAPAGEPVFAQVSPGNARSLRAFLAAGFQPIASEVLFAAGG